MSSADSFLMSVSATSSSSMDSIHIVREQSRNAELDVKDFFLKEHSDGEVEFCGTLSLDRVDLIVSRMKMTRDSMITSSWLPSTPPPPLACSLKRILVVPDKLKATATAFMKWILSVQKLKRGQPGFLGWHYPVERAKFVNTDDILVNFTKATFTMEQIVPWTSLATLKNGLASGNTSLLTSHCGFTSWLALIKVFIEVRDCGVFVENLFCLL